MNEFFKLSQFAKKRKSCVICRKKQNIGYVPTYFGKRMKGHYCVCSDCLAKDPVVLCIAYPEMLDVVKFVKDAVRIRILFSVERRFIEFIDLAIKRYFTCNMIDLVSIFLHPDDNKNKKITRIKEIINSYPDDAKIVYSEDKCSFFAYVDGKLLSNFLKFPKEIEPEIFTYAKDMFLLSKITKLPAWYLIAETTKKKNNFIDRLSEKIHLSENQKNKMKIIGEILNI